MKEKLILDEEEKKEIHIYKFERYLKKDSNYYALKISMFLFNEKIKFQIIEIQDNLINNPLLYENSLSLKDFKKISNYFKSLAYLKDIYKFINGLFDGRKDEIKKEENKILINIKYTSANKEEERTI